ncbi:hypothetical protein HPB50_013925 [Hyalomma asiaticum]|uniref:Uncharacterized protein n=1 Tax=Hyalomma asiaticum TaxID=266040 RepID=A0ACB7SE94_HYAAI|nr:hypothetical protein HPB50_013925 [Hyalomma asiaticum]
MDALTVLRTRNYPLTPATTRSRQKQTRSKASVPSDYSAAATVARRRISRDAARPLRSFHCPLLVHCTEGACAFDSDASGSDVSDASALSSVAEVL